MIVLFRVCVLFGVLAVTGLADGSAVTGLPRWILW